MEGILPTPDKLLLDNSVLEDKKMDFMDGFKERKMSQHNDVRQT